MTFLDSLLSFSIILQSKYAYAPAADPVFSLRYSRSATKLSRRLSVASTRCRSLGVGPRGPKGTQGYPRVPKGTLGGMGPRGPLGLYRSHSESSTVSIGWLLRNDSELKIVAGKPSERKGFKVLLKPLEDQGGLGSEIMPRWCMGSIGREITKQFIPKPTIW